MSNMRIRRPGYPGGGCFFGARSGREDGVTRGGSGRARQLRRLAEAAIARDKAGSCRIDAGKDD